MKTKKTLAVLAATVAALETHATVFTDWTSLDLTNRVAVGTLDGVPVHFYGETNLVYSVLDGSSLIFACESFSPPLPTSDGIYLQAEPTPRRFSFEFGRPVRDPVIHLASFASQATFSNAVTKVSGSHNFQVASNTVSGDLAANSCGFDAAGTIQLEGVFCSLSFWLHYPLGSADGIYAQLGGTAARPVLTVSRATNAVELSFPTVTGVTYQLQHSPILPATNWVSLGSLVMGNGTTMTVPDSTTGMAARFYRVQVLSCP